MTDAPGEASALRAYLEIVSEFPEYHDAAMAGTVVVLLAQGDGRAAALHAAALTLSQGSATSEGEQSIAAVRLAELEQRGIREAMAAVMKGLMALPAPLAAEAIRLWSRHGGELFPWLFHLVDELRAAARPQPRVSITRSAPASSPR